MELQQDCYRLQQVLEDVGVRDIIKFLRTKVPLIHTEIRCQLALQHFLNLQDDLAKNEKGYQRDMKDDFDCLRHLVNSASDEEIQDVLNILGPIPNRKLIAAKLLLQKNSKMSYRKKRKNDKESDICEASSSKLGKYDETETFQLTSNGTEQLELYEATENQEPLKLTIRRRSIKDRNGNDKFVVTSPPKTRSEPKTSQSEAEEMNKSRYQWRPPTDTSDPDIELASSPPIDDNLTPGVIGWRTKELDNKLPALQTHKAPSFSLGPVYFEQNLEGPRRNVIDFADAGPSTSARPAEIMTFAVKSEEPEALSSSPDIVLAPSPPMIDNKLTSSVIGWRMTEHNKLPSTNSTVQRQPASEFGPFSSFEGPPRNVLGFELSPPGPSTSARPADVATFVFKSEESETQPSTSKFVDPDEGVDLSSDINKVLIKDEPDEDLNLEKKADLPQIVDEKLVFKLIEMFEDASSDYIREICAGKEWTAQNFEEILNVIFSAKGQYPKRPEQEPSLATNVDPEAQFNFLKGILKDADPSYLHEKVDQFAGDHNALQIFAADAVEHGDYPTLKEYQRKQQLSAQQRQYTTEFNVERFVELFPDPVATFENPDRKTTILGLSDKNYVKWFMRNKYNQLYAKDVNSIVESAGNKNIVSIVQALTECLAKGCVKKSKWVAHSRPDTQNIPLLQELAYFEHKEQIYNHIENKKKQEDLERKNAKELSLLQSCSCCFDEEVMPNDILTCTGGCRFCRFCIQKGSEVAFGEGKVVFPCLMDCGAEFSLQVLQNVLPPKVFSKLAQKKAVAEVKAAGIDELETCPFCDFATIPSPDDRLFRCLNPDCMKESCRLCKEPSHVPLRCDEVEKDEAIKARTYIEDKMTEALIRECWKCNAKFIKEEGCNKMTCSCGALMCYVCRKPVKDYKHFNGQGGDRHDLCPLYTDNFSVNEKKVLQAAEDAKKQIDPAQLKNDPTADIQKHFGSKIKEAARRAKQQPPEILAQALPPVQLQEVQRLRMELREQLRLVQELDRNERRQVVNRIERWDGLHVAVGGGHRPPPLPAHQQLPPHQHIPPNYQIPAYQPPPRQIHRQHARVNVNDPARINQNVPVPANNHDVMLPRLDAYAHAPQRQ